MLLHDEVERHARRKLRLRRPRSTPTKTLESFDFSFNRKLNTARLLRPHQLMSGLHCTKTQIVTASHGSPLDLARLAIDAS